MMINAPIERTVAWIKDGISGSASFTVTWFMPHERVRASIIRVATASSGREVLLLFTIAPGHSEHAKTASVYETLSGAISNELC